MQCQSSKERQLNLKTVLYVLRYIGFVESLHLCTINRSNFKSIYNLTEETLHLCTTEVTLHSCTTEVLVTLHLCRTEVTLHLCTTEVSLHLCTTEVTLHLCTTEVILHKLYVQQKYLYIYMYVQQK